MAQSEIMTYLSKTGNKLVTFNELSSSLGINRTNIARACRKLKQAKEIEVIPRREKSFVRFLVRISKR